jgi:hypothetical protein
MKKGIQAYTNKMQPRAVPQLQNHIRCLRGVVICEEAKHMHT